jgi:hypothetical protein
LAGRRHASCPARGPRVVITDLDRETADHCGLTIEAALGASTFVATDVT